MTLTHSPAHGVDDASVARKAKLDRLREVVRRIENRDFMAGHIKTDRVVTDRVVTGHAQDVSGRGAAKDTIVPTQSDALDALAGNWAELCGGVHEIKSDADAGCLMVAAQAGLFRFVAGLLGRMVPDLMVPDLMVPDCVTQCFTPSVSAPSGSAMHMDRLRLSRHRDPDIVVALTKRAAQESGRLYGRGLEDLGLDPRRVLLVEAGSAQDVLWALEESLRARAVRFVIGQLDDVPLTPARRLALAAAQSGTACFVLTHPRSASVGAVTTRWRVAPEPCAPHPLADTMAAVLPGARRLRVVLERSRVAPQMASGYPIVLEWCDETFRLRVVSRVRDRAAAPSRQSQSQHGRRAA